MSSRSSSRNSSPRRSPTRSSSPKWSSSRSSPTKRPQSPSSTHHHHQQHDRHHYGRAMNNNKLSSQKSSPLTTSGVGILRGPKSESFSIGSPFLNFLISSTNNYASRSSISSSSSSKRRSGDALVSAGGGGRTHILDIPIRITKLIFTFVPLEDLLSCMLTCSAWYNVLGDENIKVWKINCLNRMRVDTLNSDYLKLCPTYKSKIRALTHAWNPYDCSTNASIVDHFTFQRSQVPQTSDGCRAKIGFREGRHVWQLIWHDPLGSAAVIGVATRSTVMSHAGYIPLLGCDRHSWGWNLVNNVLIHKGDSHSYYPLDPKIRYKVGEVIHVLLDCEEKTLSFKKNGQFLGIAFRDLPVPNKDLYPAISSVYGGTRVTMVYLGNISPEYKITP